MIHQLVYTSSARGLHGGTRGFTTVAATRGMSPPLISRLESLSAYQRTFTFGSSRDRLNPVRWSHVRMTLGAGTLSVVSRVAAAGADYSGRSNMLAHHLVLDATDRPESGPSAVLAQERLFIDSWDEPARYLDPLGKLSGAPGSPKPCFAWQRACGDAGWAGVAVRQVVVKREPITLIYEAGTDLRPLIDEAINLLPAKQRWLFTFSTYFTGDVAGADCLFRGVLAGTEAAAAARGAVIDLTRPRPLTEPDDPYIQAARDGRLVAIKKPISRKRVDRPAGGDPTEVLTDNESLGVFALADPDEPGPREEATSAPPPPMPNRPPRRERPQRTTIVVTLSGVVGALAILILAVSVAWSLLPFKDEPQEEGASAEAEPTVVADAREQSPPPSPAEEDGGEDRSPDSGDKDHSGEADSNEDESDGPPQRNGEPNTDQADDTEESAEPEVFEEPEKSEGPEPEPEREPESEPQPFPIDNLEPFEHEFDEETEYLPIELTGDQQALDAKSLSARPSPPLSTFTSRIDDDLTHRLLIDKRIDTVAEINFFQKADESLVVQWNEKQPLGTDRAAFRLFVPTDDGKVRVLHLRHATASPEQIALRVPWGRPPGAQAMSSSVATEIITAARRVRKGRTAEAYKIGEHIPGPPDSKDQSHLVIDFHSEKLRATLHWDDDMPRGTEGSARTLRIALSALEEALDNIYESDGDWFKVAPEDRSDIREWLDGIPRKEIEDSRDKYLAGLLDEREKRNKKIDEDFKGDERQKMRDGKKARVKRAYEKRKGEVQVVYEKLKEAKEAIEGQGDSRNRLRKFIDDDVIVLDQYNVPIMKITMSLKGDGDEAAEKEDD
ncbi:MAG: hypothetical protein WD294_15045 [Phycisphaeraceae bacterium]